MSSYKFFRVQDYKIYARRTSTGPVPGVSTEPAYRYLIHMLTDPYSMFRNQLVGNEGCYWLLIKLLF